MRVFREQRGAVLIVVLGVLAVLALLATTFATLQATEKQVARNYLDTVRAKLAAQSGIQDAEARLREYFPGRYFEGMDLVPMRPKPWKYWGADITEKADPPTDHLIEEALNPSFAHEKDQDPRDMNPEPAQLTIEGRKYGYSGVHGLGAYARNGEHYVLKVSDISGRIHVNDGVDNDPRAGADNSVSQNLKRILNVLGDIIKVPQLGDKIIAARPPGGYKHQNDLLRAVSYDEKLFDQFKDYVTVHAWVDPNVCNPVPLSERYAARFEAETGVRYYRGNPPVYRHGSDIQGVDANNLKISVPGGLGTTPTYPHESDNIKVYGHDILNPQWIEVVSRAPVNVNAAPHPVLVALCSNIQGFFVGYRRRNNPRWKGDLYLSFKQQNELRPRGPGVPSTGDELGFLMETVPVVPKEGTAVDRGREISAYELAREIIRCRERQNGPFYNYSNPNCWFAGPFKTWHQFYAFVDNLAKPTADGGAGFIQDDRPIHWDFGQETDDPSGHAPLVGLPSAMPQQRHAIQAAADAIKANFNPNVHLNETTPDENMFLRVDKTDLFVNSTEFCFLPTGYFEVESLGRGVRARDPATRDATLGDNILVAQAKVRAVFKLYEIHRETTQKHFYAGTLGPRGSSWETNNNMSIEIGPEPDNGVFPGNFGMAGEPDNEWGGYLALPTVGGLGVTKQPNTLVKTTSFGNKLPLGTSLYVPFTFDFDAGGSVVSQKEIGSSTNAGEAVDNYADYVNGRAWSHGGPYAPPHGTGATAVRIARSFRRSKSSSGTVTQPALAPFPPSDLRIDGGQVERHAAPAYMAREGGSGGIWDFNNAQGTGLVSFWWKPSYYPDLTGKVRLVWDMSRYHEPCNQKVNVWPFALWYFPSHYDVSASEVQGPKYWHNNCGQFEPSSLCFGSKQWHASSSGSLPKAHEFGHLTASLNHLGHDGSALNCKKNKPSPLRGHRWIQTAMAWEMQGADSRGVTSKLVVNGEPLYYSKWTYISMTGGWNMGHDRLHFFNNHDGGEANHIRLGATSTIADKAKAQFGYRGNHTGDQTIDEFHAWKEAAQSDPRTLWIRGRYYRPDDSYNEGMFTSAPLELDKQSLTRMLPSPSAAMPPGSGPGASGSAPMLPRQIRILGMAWTWFGDTWDPEVGSAQGGETGQHRVLYHYGAQGGLASKDAQPKVLTYVVDGLQSYGPFENDAYSPVVRSDGTVPVIQEPKNVRYRVQFRLMDGRFGDIYLATPYMDDITIFYDDSKSHLLSYVFDNRSF